MEHLNLIFDRCLKQQFEHNHHNPLMKLTTHMFPQMQLLLQNDLLLASVLNLQLQNLKCILDHVVLHCVIDVCVGAEAGHVIHL